MTAELQGEAVNLARPDEVWLVRNNRKTYYYTTRRQLADSFLRPLGFQYDRQYYGDEVVYYYGADATFGDEDLGPLLRDIAAYCIGTYGPYKDVSYQERVAMRQGFVAMLEDGAAPDDEDLPDEMFT